MIDGYKIIKEGKNSYIFITDSNVEYQIIVRPSGFGYENLKNKFKNVLEIALNCDGNTADKDYKTAKTIAKFCTEMSCLYDAVFLQMHNQPEIINNNKVQRRGLSRIKLWSRLISKYFKDCILLTNLALDPNKKNDILCIVIKKDTIYFKQLVKNFYRFCHSKMHKKNIVNV